MLVWVPHAEEALLLLLADEGGVEFIFQEWAAYFIQHSNRGDGVKGDFRGVLA